MLHQRQKGKARRLGNIKPVVALFRKRMLQGQDHHHRAHALQLKQPLEIRFREVGCQARQQRRRAGYQAAVKDARAFRQIELYAPIRLGGNARYWRGEVDLYTQLAQAAGKGVGESLKTALKSTQAGGASLEPGPHPGHIDLGQVIAKFANQKRLEHTVIKFLTVPAAHPIYGGVLLERLPTGEIAQVDRHQTKANHAEEVVTGEGQRGQGRIERVEFAIVVRNRLRARKDNPVFETQLVDQTQHMVIGLEPVVVITLHGPIPMRFLDTRCQTADITGRFKNLDRMASPRKIECGGHSANTSPNDCNIGHEDPFLSQPKPPRRRIRQAVMEQPAPDRSEAAACLCPSAAAGGNNSTPPTV